MKEATLEKATFQGAFEELDSVLTEEHRVAWKAEVEMWEDNPNDTRILNPFEAKSIGMSL